MAVYDFCDASSDDESRGEMRSVFGPHAVARSIDQAISTCWMMLPADRKNVDNVEAELSRLFDRAMKNLREDAQAFGFTGGDQAD